MEPEDVRGPDPEGTEEGEAPRCSCLSSRSLRLEQLITHEMFSSIMSDFHRHGQSSPERQGVQEWTKMTTEDFQVAIAKQLGRSPQDKSIVRLCNKIDMDGLGFIDADEFCSYLLQQLKEKDSLLGVLALPFNDPPKFRHSMLSKETICRLCLVSSPPRFISVSKDGVVATWSMQLHFQSGTQLDKGTLGKMKTKGAVWITDFVVMSNCNKMVLATSSRELIFTDISTQSYKCQYRVHDLPSIPLCLDHYSNPQSPDSPSYLLYGDISGSVAVFTFRSPLKALFSESTKGASKDGDDQPLFIGYSCLSGHSSLMSMQYLSHLHSDWVSQVSYLPQHHNFLSCSSSPSDSLILRDIDHKTNSYIYKNRKGVMCFDFCRDLDLLATGSLDHMVCIWNPYVPAKPVAILSGHNTTILSIIIAKDHNLIFSLSQDLVLCAWDIFEYVLIQTITIKFPFSQRLPDFGPKPLCLIPTRQSLVISCNEYLAEVKLGLTMGNRSDNTIFMSHKHPLCAALYNKSFHQVVSGCEGGVVNVWDVETGCQVLRFTECHGTDEITAMHLEATGRRLATGSRAGDIKVWQIANSACIKHLQRDSYTEVTGIVHILEQARYLSVGWDRRITAFKDNPNVFNVVPEEGWNGEAHSDDILCMAYSPPHYLATGSFDGTIKVWNTDLERLLMQFQSASKMKLHTIKKPRMKSSDNSVSRFTPSALKSRSSLLSFSSRPPSRRMAMRQTMLEAASSSSSSSSSLHVPVDQVLFLTRRIRSRVKGCAALVTSEAGVAKFWDIFGHKRPVGSFSMTEIKDECVLAMKTDSSNELLLAGDSVGFLAVFNIKEYCISDAQESRTLEPVARWRAHSQEVVSVEHVPHETQSLVLSASGDGTVRLWTVRGHFVGTFGQERPWDLKLPATFEHPSTPWGEMWQSDSNQGSSTSIPRGGSQALPQLGGAKHEVGGVPEEDEEAQERKKSLAMNPAAWSSVSSMSSIGTTELIPSLTDKSLGGPYAELTHKRMDDRLRRRVHLHEIDMRTVTTEKHGTVFSPFHALELPKTEDVPIPKDLAFALGKGKKAIRLP